MTLILMRTVTPNLYRNPHTNLSIALLILWLITAETNLIYVLTYVYNVLVCTENEDGPVRLVCV